MRQLIDLTNFWARHAGQRLALCTLTGKQGSSYCAPGAKKIVAIDSDESCGLLSGGCLESDIERTARESWAEMPFTKSFSTLSETDRLLGYQTGCAGVIDILFERLPDDATHKALYLPYGPARNIAGVLVANGQRRFVNQKPAVAPGEFSINGLNRSASPSSAAAATRPPLPNLPNLWAGSCNSSITAAITSCRQNLT